MKLLLVVAAALAVASCASVSLEDMEFHAWKLKFGRSYSSPSEETHRRQIWLNNRKLVLVHNIMADEGIKSYHLDMTYFADMENEEYRSLIGQGCLHSINASLPRRGSTFLHQPEGGYLPSTIDWRTRGYVTEVKNQDKPQKCGSCWAFSATGSLEGQTFKKTGKLVPLSKQQLVDCSTAYGNRGCHGGLMDDSFRYIKANGGIDTEDSYRYEAKDLPCRFNPRTIGAKCTGYVDLRQGDEHALQQAVATIGPVSVAVDASVASFGLYRTGVYNEPNCSSRDVNHAVLVVGYGTEKGQDYWLVKNSWGLKFGDKGYIKMSRNKHNQCGIATLASYPLV